MNFSTDRRRVLVAAAAAVFSSDRVFGQGGGEGKLKAGVKRLAALEAETRGRLGVAALSTGYGQQVLYRENERFPLCSTFKVLLAAGILKRSAVEPDLLLKRITYTKDELVGYSPITEVHAGKSMTVADMCAATLQHSDNTAANLLMKILGGPAGVTEFARSIGDQEFRLDRWETDLNSAIPGDARDTTTPAAMAKSLQKLTLQDALGAAERHRLVVWMQGNKTGAERIQAGVPKDWLVADKTGSGSYGTVNDIGIVWAPGTMPVVMAIYFTLPDKDAKTRNDVVAAAAQIVAEEMVGR
jgi:beta-lactamase class A